MIDENDAPAPSTTAATTPSTTAATTPSTTPSTTTATTPSTTTGTPEKQKNNPLHGLTLEAIVTALVEHYGFDELGRRVNIRCFQENPSVASSLKFLRKTPWAREKVESFYLFMQREKRRAAR